MAGLVVEVLKDGRALVSDQVQQEKATNEKKPKHKIKVDYLRMILANTITLMMKTQTYFWHFSGENKKSIKQVAGKQYPELFKATDLLQERIEVLELDFSCSLSELRMLNRLLEPEKNCDDNCMINELKEDHQWLGRLIKKALNQYSTENDRDTTRLLLQRLDAHEKAGWELDELVSAK